MAEITDEQRQAVTRDICKWEGHNWVQVTAWGDSLTRYICSRGCGAERRGIYDQTPLPLATLIDLVTALDLSHATVREIEIVNEPWKAGRDE